MPKRVPMSEGVTKEQKMKSDVDVEDRVEMWESKEDGGEKSGRREIGWEIGLKYFLDCGIGGVWELGSVESNEQRTPWGRRASGKRSRVWLDGAMMGLWEAGYVRSGKGQARDTPPTATSTYNEEGTHVWWVSHEHKWKACRRDFTCGTCNGNARPRAGSWCSGFLDLVATSL